MEIVSIVMVTAAISKQTIKLLLCCQQRLTEMCNALYIFMY